METCVTFGSDARADKTGVDASSTLARPLAQVASHGIFESLTGLAR